MEGLPYIKRSDWPPTPRITTYNLQLTTYDLRLIRRRMSNVANFVMDWFRLNPLAHVLLVLMFCDVATGLLCAIQNRALSSSVSGVGMRRKATMLILILVGAVLEEQMHAEISEVIAGFFCVAEGISVIENAASLGVPIPPVLTRVFAQLAPETPKAGAKGEREDVIDQAWQERG